MPATKCTPSSPLPTPSLIMFFVQQQQLLSLPYPPNRIPALYPRYINSNNIPAENAIRLISGINVVFEDIVVMTRSTNFP